MCENCGCSGHHREHQHDAASGMHVHTNPDGTTYMHRHDAATTREVAIGTAILSANDRIAAENRGWFRARKVLALNLISSPGSGKTELLVRSLRKLAKRNVKTAVIVGDQYGTLDAKRMENLGAPITQIETHSSCHLDAERVQGVLERAVPEGTELLFIENVGNLVCPVAFDLGEAEKVALLSTPEGEDKPLKYPALFAQARAVLLTKCDLEQVLGWQRQTCIENVRKIQPEAQIIALSAKTGENFGSWLDYLTARLTQYRENMFLTNKEQ